LRKVSAHGLGHLIAPYQKNNEGYLKEALPWQQDLWLKIINAAFEDMQPSFTKLKNFHLPAVSRYGATTPALLKWLNVYNESKLYCDQVKPFNFMLAMQAKPQLNTPKPVAAFNKDPSKARCFDRATGEKVRKNQLKTYLDSLAQYHLHPETKFLNGDYFDKGKTQRRHIIAKSIQHIGKEPNKWEEQFFIGLDSDAQIEYGQCLEQKKKQLEAVLKAIKTYDVQPMAFVARLSAFYVRSIYQGKVTPSEKALEKLYAAAKSLETDGALEQVLRDKITAMMKEKKVSIRSLAAKLEIDSSNLAKILSSQRHTPNQLSRAHAYLAEYF